MKLICIADTHGLTPELPDGDVLIHAGDYSEWGTGEELEVFSSWMEWIGPNYKNIIFVPGNHDKYFEKYPRRAMDILGDKVHVLVDSGIVIDGIRFWGSPYTQVFGDWAFMRTGEQLLESAKMIPDDTDVLITHGPPWGILSKNQDGEDIGSELLRQVAFEKAPTYHVFGHIHESHGSMDVLGVQFRNVSHRNYVTSIEKPPTVLEI